MNVHGDGVLDGAALDVGVLGPARDLLLVVRNLGTELNAGLGHGIARFVIANLKSNNKDCI
jgi:hypothetical protein